MSVSFAEMFEESQVELKMRPGSILNGVVVDIRSDYVIVNAGLKSESMIPIGQFKNDAGEVEVAIGDEVEVALDAVEDGFGETRHGHGTFIQEVPSFLRDEERAAAAQQLVRKLLQDGARMGIGVEELSRAFNTEAGVEIGE